MKTVNFVADTLILLGAVSFIAGIVFKVFFIRWLGLLPISFINFSQICFFVRNCALCTRPCSPEESIVVYNLPPRELAFKI